jgi:tetraacyldisaccharide 4'-kinase
VVAETRQRAVDHAVAIGADAIVIDGPLTTRPVRPALSILALDASSPWGSGEVVPAGDLRAPPAALLAHADHVALVDPSPTLDRSMQDTRYGLFTALARPDRLARALRSSPTPPAEVVHAPDHGEHGRWTRGAMASVRAAEARIDMWVATPKCAIHLDLLRTKPMHVMADDLVLAPDLVQALRFVHACLDPSRAAALL